MSKVEEVKAMGDEELAIRLQMASYASVGKRLAKESTESLIKHAQAGIELGAMPDYCNDLNGVAEIEKIVIEKVGYDEYENNVVRLGSSYRTDAVFNVREWLIRLTARHRAEACWLALNEQGK